MQTDKQKRALIGIVGGMGPLASTAFLSTIYEMTGKQVEQCAGRLVLYSDPTIPDRTEAFLTAQDGRVYEPFVEILRRLQHMNASRIIVCCITIHYLFPKLPPELRKNIVSLVDTICSTLKEKPGKYLLFCTRATMQLEIFQNHPLWKALEASIIVPAAEDQKAIHSLIYRLKENNDVESAIPRMEGLLQKYQTNAFIAGCTEMHLLSRYLMQSPYYHNKYEYIDPLMILAEKIARDRL